MGLYTQPLDADGAALSIRLVAEQICGWTVEEDVLPEGQVVWRIVDNGRYIKAADGMGHPIETWRPDEDLNAGFDVLDILRAREARVSVRSVQDSAFGYYWRCQVTYIGNTITTNAQNPAMAVFSALVHVVRDATLSDLHAPTQVAYV